LFFQEFTRENVKITNKELTQLLNRLGSTLNEREIRIIFRFVDKGQKNSITVTNLRLFLRNRATDAKIEKIRSKLVRYFEIHKLMQYITSDAYIVIYFYF
jgi:Ca2+-binding EF-hand superfamily protein